MRWSENPFTPLPSAQVEGERIAALLRVEPLLADRAVEKRVKECRSPRILHLATHGFFLENQARDLNQDSRSFGTLDMDRFAGAGMESPLLRSGLALAGANWKNKKFTPPPEAEDGILTAEDVTGLDLLATDLVVLSACETGLGEIQVGEGVLGLRRAFVLAGAKTLVMSLWHVADIATAILMTRFYDNLLQPPPPSKAPLGRFEALREAQFYLRNVTVGELRAEWLTEEMIERFSAGDEEYKEELRYLADSPDAHRPFESPYFWGAFICQGDPSPLDFA